VVILKGEKEMKRIITITALVLAFGLGFVFTHAYAREAISKDPFRSFETSKLIGTTVRDPSGEPAGTIQDFVVDSNGHIDFVILSHGFYDFYGEYIPYVPIPPQIVAVPFSAITIKPDEKIATLKISRSKLDFAPKFVESDLNNRRWAENVYRYYGLQLYWTGVGYTREEGSTMGNPMSEQMVKPYTLKEQKDKPYIWGYSPNSESYMEGWRW